VLLLLPEIIDALQNGRRWSGGYIGGLEVATGQQCFVTAQNPVKKIENKTYKNFNVEEVRECLIILMAYFYKASLYDLLKRWLICCNVSKNILIVHTSSVSVCVCVCEFERARYPLSISALTARN
jgi:hypothetical protein